MPRTVEQVLTIQQQPRFDPLTGAALPPIPGTQVRQDVKVRVKAGTFLVTVRTSEPLAGPPELFFIPEGKSRIDVPVQQLEPRVWRGQVTITPQTGDGTALFFIKAPDAAGNIGEAITAGKVFFIDTMPPSRPTNLNAITFPRGVVKLAWDIPPEPDVGRWLVYRSTREFTDVANLAPFQDVNLKAYYSDNVGASGRYFYAVVPVDTAGNTGPLSRLAQADVDLTPPGPPRNLAVYLSPDGILKLTWDPPTGEQPSVYNVYISTKGVITSTAGNDVLNQNVPFTEIYGVPNEDGHYWFAVTAVDANLNEGAVSNCVDVDYRFYPAVAKVSVTGRLVNGWLSTGTFPVTLTTNKPMDRLPTLTFTPLEGTAVPIPVQGTVPGTVFTGEMTVTSGMQDGVGYFKFEGSANGRRSKDIVEGEFFVIDKEAPPPPDDLTAVPNTTNKLGTITVRWKTPAGEVPQRYFLYRDTQPIVSVAERTPIHMEVVVFGNKAEYEYEDRPPVDGLYYYAVTSGDLAGNTSAPTAAVRAQANSQIPTGSIVLRTEFSGEVPTTYVGMGTVTVTLTTSKPVPTAPTLTVTPAGKAAIPVTLTGQGNVWSGTFQVDRTTGDGVATFEMVASDGQGNTGSFISSGKTFIIVTTPPTAEITIRSNAIMVADVVDQQFKVKPLSVGRHGVMLRTDTPLAQVQLTYTRPDGREVNVPLQRGNDVTVHDWIGLGGDDFINDLPPQPAWFGFIDVAADSPNGTATLTYSGVDQAGNRSTVIEAMRHMQAIRIEPSVLGADRGIPIAAYVTAGDRFQIDTVSPPPPINVRLEVRKLGVAALFWDDDPAEQARFYRVYRDLKPPERPDRGKLVSISGFGTDLTARVAVDAPSMDGTWYYAVTGLDLAGNESRLSQSVNIFIDSKKPDLKITPLPGVDDPNALIVEVESADPPSPDATVVLKFPGAEPIVRRLGDIPSGALRTEVVTKPDGTKTYIQRFKELFPMGVEVFNGTVEVVVYSPDASGVSPREDTFAQLEKAATSVQVAAQMINQAVGGRVEFPDGSVTLDIPAGVKPIIPDAPELDISLDRSSIFFVTNVNIPQPGEVVAPSMEAPPDRTKPGTLPPELILIGKAYRIELNERPQEPLRFFGSASQVGGAIQARGGLPRMRLKIPEADIERFQFTPEQLRQKLRVVKWNTAEKRWEAVPPQEYVVDIPTRTIDFPADEITTYVIVAERTPPSFSAFTPTEDEPASTFRPTISVVVTDRGTGVDGDAIVLKLDGVIVPAQIDKRDPTSMKVEYTPPQDLEGVEHIVAVFARDIVENGTTREWRFLIDNQPPRITDVAPLPGALIGTGRPVVSAKLWDLTGVDFNRTVLTVDGTAVPVEAMRFDAVRGRLIYTPASILPSGQHTLNLTVFDRQGLSSTTGDWKFTIDAIDSDQPVIEELSPAPEAVVLVAQPTIRAKLTDQISGIDPASVGLSLDGFAVAATWEEATGQLSFTPASTLAAGAHALSLEVKDRVGNAARREWNFFVDTIAPVITNRMAVDTPLLEVNKPVLLVNVTDEGSGVDMGSIRVKLDGQQVLHFNFDESTGNLFIIPQEPLAANEHSMEVSVADWAGNRVTETVVLGRGGRLTGRVRLSARRDYRGALVHLEGTTITATTEANGTFTIHNLPEGTYTVRIDRVSFKAADPIRVQVTVDQTSDLGELLLWAGDANDDGNIDLADLDLLQAAFGALPGSLMWDERCDFNGDGRINLQDFAAWVEAVNGLR